MGFITEDELDNVGDSGIGASLPTNSNQFGGRFIDESMLDSSNVQIPLQRGAKVQSLWVNLWLKEQQKR